jgi:hypothetical protein
VGDHHIKPGSPGDILEHHGVKGMRWGVRKQEDLAGRDPAGKITSPATKPKPKITTTTRAPEKPIRPGTLEFQQMVGEITRTNNPQVLQPRKVSGGKIVKAPKPKKQGLSRDQKMLLTFGALTAAGAGYYAYKHYAGGRDPLGDLKKAEQEVKVLEGMKLPAKWDTSGLKSGPISRQALGDLAGGNHAVKLLDAENLVVNTSRGYADILPKNGFDSPFVAEQHASMCRVLEEMRDKYPAIRNMNVELVPMSKVPGVGADPNGAFASVLAMRAGEARVMYNDLMTEAPSPATIRNNAKFLPGLGKKDYIAYHEMGHLLAAAHGELPAAFDLASGDAGPSAWRTWQKAEPLLHKKTFLKHGFTFKELSKISTYASTQPAEAMAELFGHYSHPEMRSRLSPDQIKRAEAMFNEMGGVTTGAASAAKAAAGAGTSQFG